MTQYQQVKEFMKFFGQQCPDKVDKISDLKLIDTRFNLIKEEVVDELLPALFKFSRERRPEHFREIMDGLVDAQYVLLGTAIAFGIGEEKWNDLCAEVHRSNMSKLWTESQLEEARRPYPGDRLEIYSSGLYRLTVNGKVIKPSSYIPANLEPIINREL